MSVNGSPNGIATMKLNWYWKFNYNIWLSTDGVIMIMCPCILLEQCGVQSDLMIALGATLCVYAM